MFPLSIWTIIAKHLRTRFIMGSEVIGFANTSIRPQNASTFILMKAIISLLHAVSFRYVPFEL